MTQPAAPARSRTAEASGETRGDAGGLPPAPAAAKVPTVILVIGMAGSGKTTFMQQLASHIEATGKQSYVINLDPAVTRLPFGANIDIRDTVNYKQVMESYNLGPNGGILTSLNLFTTKFDQVLSLLATRAPDLDYILIDTPGQIEIFTWSASGAIISDSLAATYPTAIAYIVDTERSATPSTFMSNMLYACSILYKARLPFLVTFNKADIMSPSFAFKWMDDFDAFHEALDEASNKSESYISSLTHSLCTVLEEFYSTLKRVAVSSMTGQGMPQFLEKIGECATEWHTEYRPALEASLAKKQAKAKADKEKQLRDLMADMQLEDLTAAAQAGKALSAQSRLDARPPPVDARPPPETVRGAQSLRKPSFPAGEDGEDSDSDAGETDEEGFNGREVVDSFEDFMRLQNSKP